LKVKVNMVKVKKKCGAYCFVEFAGIRIWIFRILSPSRISWDRTYKSKKLEPLSPSQKQIYFETVRLL